MKYCAKFVSFFFMFTLLINLAGPMVVSAAEITSHKMVTQEDINLALQTGIPQVLQAIRSYPKEYGISDKTSLKLGNPFEIANITSSQTTQTSSIVYFPIIANNEIIGFTTVVKIDGKLLFGDFIDNFADRYNQMLKESPSLEYTLVSSPGQSIFAIASNGTAIPLSNNSQTEVQLLADTMATTSLGDSLVENSAHDNSISWNEINSSALTDEVVIGMYNLNAMNAYENNRISGTEISSEFLRPGLDLFSTPTMNNMILSDTLMEMGLHSVFCVLVGRL